MFKNETSISGRTIGPGHPVYVVAELSANHHQDYQRAVDMIHAAHQAGADAIKIQTYTPDTITIDCDNPYFRISGGTVWDGTNLYHLYQQAYTPWDWQPELKKIADALGIGFFSTPFDFTAVDFLEEMHVPAYKIASFELIDIPLIRKVASLGKPVIMSTGMGTLDEITEAVNTIKSCSNDQLVLLKCTSSYPAPPESMNLRTIPDMAEQFQIIPGLSDHTMGSNASVVAVTLGACLIEKHFTLSRSEEGPDSQFSMEPQEFRQLVDDIRFAEKSLGEVNYVPTAKEAGCRELRRSLFAVREIAAGETISAENMRSIRPGHGLHTRHYDEIIGRYRALATIPKGTPMSWELIETISS